MRFLLSALLVMFLFLLTGCGGGGGDGFISAGSGGDGGFAPATGQPGPSAGTGAPGTDQPNTGGPNTGGPVLASTGDLRFSFIRAQALAPTDTVSFRFDFRDSSERTLYSKTLPFAAEITVEDVPTSARSVEITALNAGGSFLGSLLKQIGVRANALTVINLTGSLFFSRLDSLTLLPNQVSLDIGETRNLSLMASFSDGTTVGLPSSEGAWTSDNSSVVSVSNNGVLTGGAAGSTRVRVSVTRQGATRSTSIPVTVTDNLGPLRFSEEHNSQINIPELQPGTRFTLISISFLPLAGGPAIALDPNDPNLTINSTPRERILRTDNDQIYTVSGALVLVHLTGFSTWNVQYDDPISGESFAVAFLGP